MKNCDLNFREFPVTKSIFEIFGKEDNRARYAGIFGDFLPEISFPFYFSPGISGIVRFSEKQQFPDFLETFHFHGAFRIICPRL